MSGQLVDVDKAFLDDLGLIVLTPEALQVDEGHSHRVGQAKVGSGSPNVRQGFLFHHATEQVTSLLNVVLVVIEQALEARTLLLGEKILGRVGGLERGLPDGQRPFETVIMGA